VSRRTFRFYVPAMVILDVEAPSRAVAKRVAADWQHHANRWEYVAELSDVADAFEADNEADEAASEVDSHALVVIDMNRGPHLAVIEGPDGDTVPQRRKRCAMCGGTGRLRDGRESTTTCGACAGKGYPWTPCRNFAACGRAARYGDVCSRACREAHHQEVRTDG
jgi:hypothetical protein